MIDYNPEKTVVIVGYPRSGNTWLARLIAEALDSPMSRFRDALPLGVEGGNRPGDWLVTQLHLKPNFLPDDGNGALVNAWQFNVNAWRGENLFLIYRDPRDVAISAKYYWDLRSNREALDCMINGSGVLEGVGKWVDFYDAWESTYLEYQMHAFKVAYEGLYRLPELYISEIMEDIGVEISPEKIEEIVRNQEFQNKRNQIANEAFGGNQNERPYGKEVQLKAMHTGVPHKYRTDMSDEDNQYAIRNFKETMYWMGYPLN